MTLTCGAAHRSAESRVPALWWVLLGCLAVPALPQEPSGLRILSIDATDAPTIRVTVDPGDIPMDKLADARAAEATEVPVPLSVDSPAPLWVMVLIDCGPAAPAERRTISATLDSLASTLPPDTQVGVVLAGEAIRTIGFARGPDRLGRLIAGAAEAPVARLRDGMIAAVSALSEVAGAKALVALHAVRDDTSHVAPGAPAVIGPVAGCLIHSLAASPSAEPSIVEAARATGGRVEAPQDATAAREIVAALCASLQRRVTLQYRSTSTQPGWRALRLLVDQDTTVETRGYLAPPSVEAVEIRPEIKCPVQLPPTPIVFYSPGSSALRNWALANGTVRLDPGLYRGVALTRPVLTRSVVVTVSGPSQFAFSELGALRVVAPSIAPGPHPYEVQLDGSAQRLGGARTGDWVPLPPGTYRVVSLGGPDFRSERIGVVAHRRSEVDLSRWAVLQVMLQGRDDTPLSVPLAAIQGEARLYTGETNRALALPPGSWRLSVATTPPQETLLELAPGTTHTLPLPPLGGLRVGLLSSNGDPVQWAWTAHPQGREEPIVAGLTEVEVPLVAGAYEVALAGWPDATFNVEIEQGRVCDHPLGRLVRLLVEALDHDGAPARVKYNVIDASTGAPLASGVTGEAQDILPGVYELDLWTHPRLLVTDMVIQEAEDGLIQFGPTGGVALAMGMDARIGLYRLEADRRAEPAVVIDSGEVVEVLPGRYAVTVLSPPGVRFDDEIVVRGGEVTHVELTRVTRGDGTPQQ